MKKLILIILFFSINSFGVDSDHFWQEEYEVKKLPKFLNCMTDAEKKEAQIYRDDKATGHDGAFLHRSGTKRNLNNFNNRLGKAKKLKKWICVPGTFDRDFESLNTAEFIEQMEIERKGSTWRVKVIKGDSLSSYPNGVTYKLKKGKKGILSGKTKNGSLMNMRPLTQDGGDSRFMVFSFYGNGHILCYQESLHNKCNPFEKKSSIQQGDDSSEAKVKPGGSDS